MKEKEKNVAFDMLKEPERTEIASGMTTEEIKALFFDASALREPKYKVYRLDSNGYRYYYRFNEVGEPEFYPSVTTLLRQVMPTSPFLISWMMENGKEQAEEKRDLSAAYGTLMHMEFERLIISRKYDFDAVPEIVRAYMSENHLPDKFFGDSVVKLRKDVLAFAQFIKDYNVKPLAIEIALVHPEHHFAGCVDMPCEMVDTKTGEVFKAIVDFKSGRKGFFEEHEIQLHLYAMMWNVNFPDVQIERVFNFSPKDWRTKPMYNLKDQTDSPNAAKVPALLQIAAIEDEKRNNTITIVQGSISLDNNEPLRNILSISLAELVKSKTTKEEKAEIRPNSEPKEESEGNTPLAEGKANTDGICGIPQDLFDEDEF